MLQSHKSSRNSCNFSPLYHWADLLYPIPICFIPVDSPPSVFSFPTWTWPIIILHLSSNHMDPTAHCLLNHLGLDSNFATYNVGELEHVTYPHLRLSASTLNGTKITFSQCSFEDLVYSDCSNNSSYVAKKKKST